jgi:hypothetical protein
MSAVSNVVINDGATTPVAHTFNPARVSPELVTYQDRSAAVVAGYNVLTIGTRYASNGNSGQKVTLKIVAPTLAVTAPTTGTGIQPNPVAAYSCLATVEFVLPSASTLQNRKDILAFVKNLMAQTVVSQAVQDLDPPF